MIFEEGQKLQTPCNVTQEWYLRESSVLGTSCQDCQVHAAGTLRKLRADLLQNELLQEWIGNLTLLW